MAHLNSDGKVASKRSPETAVHIFLQVEMGNMQDCTNTMSLHYDDAFLQRDYASECPQHHSESESEVNHTSSFRIQFKRFKSIRTQSWMGNKLE